MANFQNYKPPIALITRNTTGRFWSLSFEIWDLSFVILCFKMFLETKVAA